MQELGLLQPAAAEDAQKYHLVMTDAEAFAVKPGCRIVEIALGFWLHSVDSLQCVAATQYQHCKHCCSLLLGAH